MINKHHLKHCLVCESARDQTLPTDASREQIPTQQDGEAREQTKARGGGGGGERGGGADGAEARWRAEGHSSIGECVRRFFPGPWLLRNHTVSRFCGAPI